VSSLLIGSPVYGKAQTSSYGHRSLAAARRNGGGGVDNKASGNRAPMRCADVPLVSGRLFDSLMGRPAGPKAPVARGANCK
jgi:hypothetical protein